MLKPLLLASMVLAQVSAAPMPPMPPRVPMPTMAVPERMDGITVTGNGYAGAQATEATVSLHVMTRSNALTLTRQSLQPVVDALVKAGADASSVQLPPYMVGDARTNNATITAAVHHPTLALLQHGMLTMATTFAGMPDVLLNNAEVRLTAQDCTVAQRSAEADAITKARANAAFLAQQIGAKVGSVLAINAAGMAMGMDNACTLTYSIGQFGMSPQMSPADMLTVKIYSNVTMRFAIVR